MSTVTWALQPLPSGKSVYVVTPPDQPPTWNMRAASRLVAANVPHIVTSQVHPDDDVPDLDKLLVWEQAARKVATVILYLMPCGTEPGMDFGYDVALGRSVVLCVPHEDCAPRALLLAQSHSVPVRTNLTSAVSVAARWMRWGFPS